MEFTWQLKCNKTLITGITVPFLHRAQLWVERFGMPCDAEHARTLSRQYVCSLHFSETDFTVGDKTKLERLGVPNPFTVAPHSNSAQHHGGPSSNSPSFEEYLHVLVPTKTYSKKSRTSSKSTQTPPYLHLYPLTCLYQQKPALFQKKTPPFPLSLQMKVLMVKNSDVSIFRVLPQSVKCGILS